MMTMCLMIRIHGYCRHHGIGLYRLPRLQRIGWGDREQDPVPFHELLQSLPSLLLLRSSYTRSGS